MKKELTKIWGVGLTIVLAASLLLSAAPVSGGTLDWGKYTPFPSTTGHVLAPSFDVADLAVSGDGVLYAVNVSDNATWKSTNGGTTWSRLSKEFLADVAFIAVAPDDSDIVAVAYPDSYTSSWNASISTNGGSTWGDLAQIVVSGVGITTLTDLAVSASDGTKNYVGVAGTDDQGDADAWYFNAGATAPKWKSTNNETAFGAMQDGLAIAFSPNVASDKTMVLVAANSSGDEHTTMQLLNLSTEVWNTPFDSGFPVNIQNDSNNVTATSAAIGLAPDYLGSDDSMRVAFVGLKANLTYGGIYRLKNTTDKAISDDKDINSIDYDGTNLVAGESDTNKVWRSDNALATSPDFSGASSLKRPSGENNVIVAWSGSDVVAGTRGDSSAFSVSEDNGKSFNGISLISVADDDNGTLGSTLDVEVSADGEIIYMLTQDSEALSLFRRASSWERVLSIVGGANTFIVRIAPDDPDAVYVAETGTDAKTIYYSQDGGDTKWFTRVAKYDIGDLAVESADVAYVAVSGTSSVSKTVNSGFIWASSQDTAVTGQLNMIRSLGEDKIIVGSNSGYVGYSSDGNDSWSRINTQLTTNTLNTVQVTASGLADGDFVYAATTDGGRVERWEIGQSGTSWKNLECPATTSFNVTGMALAEGVLYVQTINGTANTTVTQRTLNPTTAEPAGGNWSSMTEADAVMDVSPQALKVSSGSTMLWGVDTDAPSLYVYTDTLAVAGPTLVSPANGATILMNPVSGKANAVALTWERPSKAKSYDVRVALDSGFTEVVKSAYTSNTTDDPVSMVVGPDTDESVAFSSETTYYWRIRVRGDGPVKSPWSETRSFTIGTLPEIPVVPVEIVIPPAPVISVPEAPSITITPPEIVLPAPPPAPPEIVIPPAPSPPAPITPAYIWAIIIIGAILVIAVVVLIIRTRRPV